MPSILESIPEFYEAISRNNLETLERLLIAHSCPPLSVKFRFHHESLIESATVWSHEATALILRYVKFSDDKLPNDEDMLNLKLAVMKGEIVFMNKWLQHGFNFNAQNSKGETSLHFVPLNGVDSIMCGLFKFLLDRGADPSIKNNKGRDSLSVVVFNCVIEYDDLMTNPEDLRSLMCQLVRAGADINSRNNRGMTALHLVDLSQTPYLLISFFRFGADINVCDNDGKNVFDNISEQIEELKLNPLESTRECENNLFEAFKILFDHIICMRMVGILSSEKIHHQISLLREWYESMKNKYVLNENIEYGLYADDERNFKIRCSKELERLEASKLDGNTSLRSFLMRTSCRGSRFVKKAKVREYFEAGLCEKDFPIYSHLLELYYRDYSHRNAFLPLARIALKSLNLPLPDVCLECILENFTNRDLIKFLRNFDSNCPEFEKCMRSLSCQNGDCCNTDIVINRNKEYQELFMHQNE